jgi:hypothetical protein
MEQNSSFMALNSSPVTEVVKGIDDNFHPTTSKTTRELMKNKTSDDTKNQTTTTVRHYFISVLEFSLQNFVFSEIFYR